MGVPDILPLAQRPDHERYMMSDHSQQIQSLYEKKLREYGERFHEPYLHFGEPYPTNLSERVEDIQHWLDIDKPKPWDEVPDDVFI